MRNDGAEEVVRRGQSLAKSRKLSWQDLLIGGTWGERGVEETHVEFSVQLF